MDIKVTPDSALIFDLDDTLYHEIEFLKSAYIEIAKQLEPNKWQFLYAQMFALYRNENNVFDFLSQKYATSKKDLITSYREHQPSLEISKTTNRLLLEIKNKKGKLGIVTDGRATTQRNKLSSLGILGYFDFIVISEVLGTEKPNPKNFEAIEENLPAKEYYYIGDNFAKDFVAPNQMGWKTIGLIDNGLNIHAKAHLCTDPSFEPQYFIQDLDEIVIS